MKRLLLVLLVSSILITAVSARPIALGIGNYARHFESVYDGVPAETILDPTAYSFGTDVRLQLLILEFTMNGTFINGNEFYSGIMTVGIRTPLFGFLDLGLGIGPFYGIYFNEGESRSLRLIRNDSEPQVWRYLFVENFGEVFSSSLIGYRLHLDAHIGKFSLGVSLEAPTVGYTIDNGDFQAMDIQMDKMRSGASALYWF
ncbi:MAG TPA: hypothetical protein VKZ39_03940 [Sphaerochaetaceae bacterium]|nr:hypothetical protein [Sphaerochaetaceae bacterium]